MPPLAAARIVRWTLKLAAYDYDIEFKPTKQHGNADMLSRLPLSNTENDAINSITIMQIDNLPVTVAQLQKATKDDRVLSKVFNYLVSGIWPDEKAITNELKPFYAKRNDLSLHDGIVMWGLRVVVPYDYRERIITELHDQHPGIVRMKELSRIHVWFPNIDRYIADAVKSCYECSKHKNKPPKAFIHPWNWPTSPFDRIHVDFFSLYGKDYLLLVDSHSKWVELEHMTTTKCYHMIAVFRRWFVQFGIPLQLVIDNGPQFVSHELSQFLQLNGIKHIRCSAYHPCSNGGAERFVQTIKNGLKKCHIEKGNCTKKLQNFLFAYRNTPSTVTGKTPSELFLGRRSRTRLDIMKPTRVVFIHDPAHAIFSNKVIYSFNI